MIKKALKEALDQYTVGVSANWDSPKTGRAGRAIVTDTFERNGLRCAQLTHQFTKGPGRTYTAPLCQTKDGVWRLAF